MKQLEISCKRVNHRVINEQRFSKDRHGHFENVAVGHFRSVECVHFGWEARRPHTEINNRNSAMRNVEVRFLFSVQLCRRTVASTQNAIDETGLAEHAVLCEEAALWT